MLGVKPGTLNGSAFKWRPMLRGKNKVLRGRGMGSCSIYPRAVIENILAAQAEAAKPPPGWVTKCEAAKMLGVKPKTLTADNFKWRPMLQGQFRLVHRPDGSVVSSIYPRELIERLAAVRAEDLAMPAIPEGFVDKAGAERILDIAPGSWNTYTSHRKIRIGRNLQGPAGKSFKIYAINDVEQLRETLFGADKIFKDGKTGIYHLPAEFVTRRQAWQMFGVSKPIWERWESERKITCGRQLPGGPKVYRVDDIERLLDENGKLAPPYPDPDRQNVYRVPLAGRDIPAPARAWHHRRRRGLPLVAGHASCTLCGEPGWAKVYVRIEGGRAVPLRRLILGVRGQNAAPRTDEGLRHEKRNVRHVNGDPLDCRRENLMLRTISQTVRNNRKVRHIQGKRPTSRFKGVCWHTAAKSWLAQISKRGEQRRLGYFHDETDAAEAYDDAAREFFGAHARLNFPAPAPAAAVRASSSPPRPLRRQRSDSTSSAPRHGPRERALKGIPHFPALRALATPTTVRFPQAILAFADFGIADVKSCRSWTMHRLRSVGDIERLDGPCKRFPHCPHAR